MCSIDWAEGPLVANARTPKAIKVHTCHECRREISPGESYENYSGLYEDSGWINCKTCAHCLEARRWLHTVCDGWVFEGVAEEIKDHWDEYRELPLGRLVLLQRRKWEGITPEEVATVVSKSRMFQEVRGLKASVAH
jgi:hypothetical protein